MANYNDLPVYPVQQAEPFRLFHWVNKTCYDLLLEIFQFTTLHGNTN